METEIMTAISTIGFPIVAFYLMYRMVNEQLKPDTLLSQLQTVNFAVQELALYLDTHRDDGEALELYRSYQEMYGKLRRLYEEQCGPLNHMHAQEGPYRWLDDPWPWEYCANREG